MTLEANPAKACKCSFEDRARTIFSIKVTGNQKGASLLVRTFYFLLDGQD